MKTGIIKPIIISAAGAVLGTIIIAIIKPLRNFFWNIFKCLLQIFLAFLKYLNSPIRIPNWLFFSLLILLSFLLLKAALKWIHGKNKFCDPHRYIKDTFDNITWRWSYDSDLKAEGLAAFCPNCDMQLKIERESRSHSYTIFYYYCDKCYKKFDPIRDLKDYVSHLKREIERRIRTGEWMERVKLLKGS